MTPHRIPARDLLCYSIGNLGQTAFMVYIAIYLMFFYTDVIMLDASYVGYALGLALLIDAITDPIMGYVSDRTKTRWGRRRPYLILGAIPTGFLLYLLFTPPFLDNATLQAIPGLGEEIATFHQPEQEKLWLFGYLLVIVVLLRTTFTIFTTPYLALAPELSSDYNEQVRLSGYRKFCDSIGELVGVLVPVILFAPEIMGDNVSERDAFSLSSIILGIVIITAALITFWGVREKSNTNISPLSFRESFSQAFRNKAFVIFFLASFLIMFSERIVTSTMPYVGVHYQGRTLDQFNELALVYFIGAFLSVPIWFIVGQKLDKKVALLAAIVLYPISLSSLVVDVWSDEALSLLMIFVGFAASGIYMMLMAIFADIVELDYSQVGHRREGIYSSMQTFGIKVAMGLGITFLGIVLSQIGYIEGAGSQNPETITQLRIAFVAIPTVAAIIAGIIFFQFPINREKHSEILREIQERHGANS